MSRERSRAQRGGFGRGMDNREVPGDPSSHSESTKSQHSITAVAVSLAQSPDDIEALVTLESISA